MTNRVEAGLDNIKAGLRMRPDVLKAPSEIYAAAEEVGACCGSVRDSDGTVVLSIGPALTGGSKKTVNLAHKHGKPVLHLSRDGG